MRTGRPKPGNRSARSGRKRDPKVIGAVRPTSLTGRKSIAKDVANMVVPWLGTRFAGLFWVSQRPLNGYARSIVGVNRHDPVPVLASAWAWVVRLRRRWL